MIIVIVVALVFLLLPVIFSKKRQPAFVGPDPSELEYAEEAVDTAVMEKIKGTAMEFLLRN